MSQITPFPLHKNKTFNEVLNDSVSFIRIHKQRLLWPFFLAMLPISILQFIATFFLKNKIPFLSPANTAQELFSRFGNQGLYDTLLSSFLVYGLGLIAGTAIVTSYIKLYSEDPFTLPTTTMLFRRCGSALLKISLASIPLLFLSLIAYLFFFVPGIWFSVVLWIFFPVYILEGRGLGQSLTQARALLSGFFWQTFGLYIVSSLIVVFFASFFSTGGGILALVKNLHGDYHGEVKLDLLSSVLISLGTLVRLTLQILVYVCATMQYYSLKERKEGSSLSAKIAALGTTSSSPTFQRVDEEY